MSIYKRIPEKPRVVADESDFTRLAERIARWCVQPGLGLRMGAVWGERGSGKTSMIETVQDGLKAVNNEDRVVGATLFEPAKLEVDEGNLIFGVLDWLKNDVLQGGPDDVLDTYQEFLVFEAKLRDPGRFLEYETETATDASRLADKTAGFYAEISMPTKKRLDFFLKLFHRKGRYVVFVDDVDLSPSLGPAILELFHIHFPNVSLTVLFAADRGTLLTAFDRHLERKNNAHIGLASKTLAKYLDVEWYLPTPTLTERRAVVEDGRRTDEGDTVGEVWLDGSLVWQPFRPPLYRKQAIDPERVPQRRGRGDYDYDYDYDDDGDDGRPFEEHHAKQLADDLLPRTWRGVNRVYNRMAELFESLGATGSNDESVAQLVMSLAGAVGTTSENTPSFMRLLVAFDESYPELGLYQSFVEDPDELRDSMAMSTEDAWKRTAEKEVFPVVQRLGQLDPSRRPRAERLLLRFAWLWQELWQQPKTDPGTFVGLSVRDNALKIAGDWAAQFFDEDRIVHLDLLSAARATPTRDRITPESVRDVCGDLKKRIWGEHPEIPGDGAIVVFPRAPLSVCAYLGYLMRDRDVAAVFGQGRSKLASLRLSQAGPAVDLGPWFVASRGEPGRVDGEGEAMVVLAVGGVSGVSEMTLWYGQDGTPVSAEGPQPFVYETEKNYRVRDEDGVAGLVFGALEVLSKIRADGAQRIHLGLKMPAALAVLLGTRLSSVQPVLLYEWSANNDRAAYDWVCTVEGGPKASGSS